VRPCWCCRPGRAGSHCWSQPPEQQAQVDRPLRARPGSLRPPPAARTHLDKSVGTQQSVDDLTHRRKIKGLGDAQPRVPDLPGEGFLPRAPAKSANRAVTCGLVVM